MSNYKIYIAFVCFLTLSVHGQMTSADFLKADGTVLRNNNGLGDTITLRGTNLEYWLSMEYWMGPVGKGSLNRSTWQASASSSYPGTDLQNVFDRDLSSRWSSGLAQIPDGSQYFMVDMQENVLFNRVSFEAGSQTGDYPRGYKIEVSEDANNWEEVMSGTGSTENTFVQLPNIYFKRYIKITQTGTANSNFWSIAEFNLYMEDDFTVRNSLIDRFGEDGADVVLDSFQKAWITTNDLDNIKVPWE
ncbi:discoidin domain-containing protein [Thalassobellus suaedae]|uniref:Discoidin domain-containing protein n=1 Tax=Thalassobellus suaedae TaxID=3074124 RepID=A0ABY9XTE4_9FLAO|nr:discoidin domain-containing protein [Flavobacteriaceae bacterium HL-DH14]